MEFKYCSVCHQEKSITEYYRDYSIANFISYRAKCKECTKNLSKNRIQRPKTEINVKECSCCNRVQKIDNFYKSTRHLDGYFSHCKTCHKDKLENVGFNIKIKRTPEYMKQYWKDKLKDVHYRMKQNIRRYISQRLENKKHKTTKYIGCSVDFFIKWIEFRFDETMSWENYALYWELDHVVPCASFDFKNETDIMTCFNWKNYQPLAKIENLKKSNKIDDLYILIQQSAIEEFLSKYINDIEILNNYYSLKNAAPCG